LIPGDSGLPLAAVKRKEKFKVVLVTAPDIKTARRLAKTALTARLAACANLVPKIESHYWWQGKLEHADEILIVFKTTLRCAKALEKLVLVNHPYDTPEFICLLVESGSRRYLDWIASSVR
jgi:periplasmic divalent cation tolerance protein